MWCLLICQRDIFVEEKIIRAIGIKAYFLGNEFIADVTLNKSIIRKEMNAIPS